MQKTYRLMPITDLDETKQLQILDIRNEDYIRRCMLTGNIITRCDHLSWIERLKTDRSQICFVIIDDDSNLWGSVNLKKIDNEHKTAELGFYRTQKSSEKGIMMASLSILINYSFDILGLEKIYSEVFEDNIKSINIHERLLFVKEGFLRSHIVKNKIRIGLHLFGLLKDDWQNGIIVLPTVKVAINV